MFETTGNQKKTEMQCAFITRVFASGRVSEIEIFFQGSSESIHGSRLSSPWQTRVWPRLRAPTSG